MRKRGQSGSRSLRGRGSALARPRAGDAEVRTGEDPGPEPEPLATLMSWAQLGDEVGVVHAAHRRALSGPLSIGQDVTRQINILRNQVHYQGGMVLDMDVGWATLPRGRRSVGARGPEVDEMARRDNAFDGLALVGPQKLPFPCPPYVGPPVTHLLRYPIGAKLGRDRVYSDTLPGVKRSSIFCPYDPPRIDELLCRARDLLHPVEGAIRASYLRGQRSSTPPLWVHPLMDLCVRVERGLTAASFRPYLLDWAEVAELRFHVAVLSAWTTTPWGPALRNALKGPHEYWHTLFTLAFADSLGRRIGPVVLPPQGSTARIADLGLLLLPNRDPLIFEVKVPRVLVRSADSQSRVALTPEEAGQIVEKAWKSMGSGTHGQLASVSTGILTVCGVHIYNGDEARLAEAARRFLGRRGAGRPNLAGIQIMLLNTARSARRWGYCRVMPVYKVLLNPAYHGTERVEQFLAQWRVMEQTDKGQSPAVKGSRDGIEDHPRRMGAGRF